LCRMAGYNNIMRNVNTVVGSQRTFIMCIQK
jgi:hypothetical protein